MDGWMDGWKMSILSETTCEIFYRKFFTYTKGTIEEPGIKKKERMKYHEEPLASVVAGGQ